ncbi:hypothetical protein E2320_022898 [Naja naja]|nr:hypothetical protein E2320_022898 [Naja naja]
MYERHCERNFSTCLSYKSWVVNDHCLTTPTNLNLVLFPESSLINSLHSLEGARMRPVPSPVGGVWRGCEKTWRVPPSHLPSLWIQLQQL